MCYKALKIITNFDLAIIIYSVSVYVFNVKLIECLLDIINQ